MMKGFSCCLVIFLFLCNCAAEEDDFDCSSSEESSESDESNCNKRRNSKEKEPIRIDESMTIEGNCNVSTTTYSCSGSKEEFDCSSEGRFPDLSDPTCRGYYQCDKLNDGTLKKKKLKCPSSPFCPSTQKCSSLFICPCASSTSSTTTSSTASQEPTTTQSSEKPGLTTVSEGFTVEPEKPATPFVTKSTNQVLTTIGYTCTLSNDEVGEFTCAEWGRFPDFTDPSCQKYFLCSYLQNGSFVKTEYNCLNSVFDPSTKRCSKQYVCPCSIVSSTPTTASPMTTSEDTTTTSTHAPTTTSSVTTTEESKTTSSSSVTTTTSKEYTTIPIITTTGYICSAPTSEDDEFHCTVWGRFPDLRDPTCRRYFLCSYLQNGSFVKTEYKCLKSVFDPGTKRCSKQYVCPCSAISSTPSTPPSVVTTTPQEVATTASRESTTASVVITTTEGPKTTINSTISEPSTAPTVATTIPVITTTGYTCTPSLNNTDEFSCTEWGRFPDLTDPTCQKYFLCSFLQNGSFVKTEYKCLGAVFDPVTKRCSKQYVCPCSTPSSTSSTGSSTMVPFTSTTTNEITTALQGSTTLSSESTITQEPTTSAETTSSKEFTTISTTSSATTPVSRRTTTTSDDFTTASVVDTTTARSATLTDKPTTTPAATATSEKLTTVFTTTTAGYTCSESPKDGTEFNCAEWGRFPDLTDPSCQKYFLCSYLQNGSFVKTEYKCLNSVFDPTTKRCSKQYVCPCSTLASTPSTVPSVGTTTSEEVSTLKTTEGPEITTLSEQFTSSSSVTTSATESDVATTTERKTTEKPTTTPVVTTSKEFTTTPITTTTGYTCSSSPNDEDNFNCTEWGRFPDLTDISCQRYFLCSFLQNGSFVKTVYKCLNSVFDPTTKRCSKQYVCPCSIISSTSPTVPSVGTTISEEVTRFTTTEEPELTTLSEQFTSSSISSTILTTESDVATTTERKTTERPTTTPAVTTSKEFTTIPITTTTGYTCSSSPNDEDNFNCTEWGRFPDLTDISCQRYFLCSFLQNGSFVKTVYKCLNSVFDPTTKRCSKQYVCPCSIISSTSPTVPSVGTTTSEEVITLTTTEESEQTTLSEQFTSSSSSVATSTTEKLTTVSDVATTTERKTTERPTTTPVATTTKEFTTTPITTTTGYTCSSSPNDEDNFNCTEWGRFPDLTDISCQRYFLCSFLQNGSFVKTVYKCLNSVFDPITKRCSKQYVCPCSIISSTSPTVTSVGTTTSEEVITLTTTEESELTTLSEQFTSSSSSVATSTIENLTTESDVATTTERKITEKPITTPVATTSNEFTTIPITTTTGYTCSSSPNDEDNFNCTEWGRFPDLTDVSCQRYFLCSFLQNGSFVKTVYNCLNSVFDPRTKRCSKQYVCPCSTPSSTSSTTFLTTLSTKISTTEQITPEISTTKGEETTWNSTSSLSTAPTVLTTLYDCTAGSTEKEYDFACAKEGRFPDFSDVTCTSYFLCSHLRNGTFIKTPYICLNSYFNPLTSRCSLSYICPCKDNHTVFTTPVSVDSELPEDFPEIY